MIFPGRIEIPVRPSQIEALSKRRFDVVSAPKIVAVILSPY
jgi:hypothetical protein